MTAYADLGGLGARQGSPVSFTWRLPNLLPTLLPWLVILGLLALPSNRQARAWWLWVPLAGVALVGLGVQTAADAAENEGLSYSVQAAAAATFGLAAVWLLGVALARCCRTLGIVLTTLAFAAVGLLAFGVGPVWEQLSDLIGFAPEVLWYLLLFAVLSGLAYAGALNLAGWRCRKRFSRWRCTLWLPLWLWAMWLVVGGLGAWVATIASGGRFEWLGLAIWPLILALMSFALMLPFLVLSFASSFYRERLKSLLRLPATEPAPPPPVPAPVAAQSPGAELPG